MTWQLWLEPINSMIWETNGTHFFKGIWWSVVSNAFWRSINIKPVIKRVSQSLKIFACKQVSHELVEWFLRNLNDRNQSIAWFEKPMTLICFKSISWSIASNVFCRSINITPVTERLSKSLKISSCKQARHELDGWFLRNPN